MKAGRTAAPDQPEPSTPMASFAKLSPPRLFDIVSRHRLFAALDALARHPAVWIQAPPGAGKTALVASYVEARGRPARWYQVDEGDRDVATFFDYLAQLAPPGPALPAFKPEYRAHLALFARRFFRSLFARQADATVLVLDNLQEGSDSPAFLTALQAAIEEVPPGQQLLLASRLPPPAGLARQLATGAIATLGWPELMLSADEAAEIAGLEPLQDTAGAARLVAVCGGWAAGLTLMLARAGSGPGLPAEVAEGAEAPDARQAAFDFLAAEILDHSDPVSRDFLLRSWALPSLTPSLASAASGCAEAGAVLARLHRENFFVERRQAAGLSTEPGAEAGFHFQYHALFRAFLADRARQTLGEVACRALQLRAGEALAQAGRGEEAIPLLLAAEDWAAAGRALERVAPAFLAHSRIETLGDWLARLPPAAFTARPGLACLRGEAELPRNPARARTHFEAAWAAQTAAGDPAGRLRAAVGVLESIYLEWADFSATDPWIARLEEGLDDPAAATPELQPRALAIALVTLLYRQPTNPRLPAYARQVRSLVAGDGEPNARLAAATFLLNYWTWVGKPEAAREVLALAGPLADDPAVTPLRRAWWALRCAYQHHLAWEPERALQWLAAAEALAADHGLPTIALIARFYRVFVHLARGDLARAGALLVEIDACLDPRRRLDVALAAALGAWHEILAGRPQASLRRAAQAAGAAAEAGVPNIEAYFRLLCGHAAAQLGQSGAAAAHLARATACTDAGRFPVLAFLAGLVQAHATPGGDRPALAAALALGAREGYRNTLFWLPGMMSTLAARALQEGIESAYVTELIRQRHLPPPAPGWEPWPWPLRLHTLGGFRVERQGEPLRFASKAQKRPLALLMALVALGGQAGDGVASTRLAEALWPDAEGDAARSALGTTLFRLRHLLEDEEAIRLSEGKLSLDPDRVWVDAWALEALAGAAEPAVADLLRLYRGHFLEREEDAPWMIAPRERLRGLFLRAVDSLGQGCEAAGHWQEAAELYRGALTQDSLAESLYCHLMRCYRELGRPADALETYRRCRQALSISLGLAPSAETEALRRSLEA
jgi:DNA-binding SARP family transcriptional activator